ncbi:hypothetical protein Bbelb_055430 [Branchiostoma belcheri]|nr:hypothetical protein Bbelb_055430 [Branchiostoma belcheri]
MTSPLHQDVNKDMENEVELPTIDHNYEDIDNKIYNYIDVDRDYILNELQTGEEKSAGTPVAAGSLRNAMHEPGPLQQTKDGVRGSRSSSPPDSARFSGRFCTTGIGPTDVQSPTGERLPGGNNLGYVPGALRKDEKEDSIGAANICGRLKSYKCHRPSLLRVIAITIAVVALLGAGVCVFMYLSSMENKNADPPIKESPNKLMLKTSIVSSALSKMAPAQAWLATTLPDNTTELPQMADTQPDQLKSLPGVISTDKTGISTNETAHLTTERDQAAARPPPVHGGSFGNIHG